MKTCSDRPKINTFELDRLNCSEDAVLKLITIKRPILSDTEVQCSTQVVHVIYGIIYLLTLVSEATTYYIKNSHYKAQVYELYVLSPTQLSSQPTVITAHNQNFLTTFVAFRLNSIETLVFIIIKPSQRSEHALGMNFEVISC